jgi:hypothetical protein
LFCLVGSALAWTIEARAQATGKAQPAQAKTQPAQTKAQPESAKATQPAAQTQYRELRADAQLKEWNDIVTKRSDPRMQKVESMLSGATSLDNKEFGEFFNSVVFPQFTRSENIFAKKGVRGAPTLKSTVCLLPDMRKGFKQQFLDKATNHQAHDKLNELTLQAMTHIAAENYHPIARYNAMLLISELDQDASGQAPYKPALDIMVSASVSEKVPEAVRVAALIGIVRHANAGIDAAKRNSVAGSLAKILTDSKPPADRAQEGHDWMRRRALEALTAMYGQNPPPGGAFLQLLDTVLADTNSTVEFRADAVEAFLTSKFVAPATFDSAKFAAGIGQVAVDAYHTELDTSLRLGRKVYPDGMTYYFRLVDKALDALDKSAPAPTIAKLKESLAELAASTVLEEPPLDAPVDPTRELKLYDQIAKAGADFESLVTGKPVSDILPKRGKVGGNAPAGTVGGYGGGYGATGGGGYGRVGGSPGYGGVAPRTSPDRSGYGRVPAPAPRGNFGGAR